MSFMWCAPHRWSFEPAGPHPLPTVALPFEWCAARRSHFAVVTCRTCRTLSIRYVRSPPRKWSPGLITSPNTCCHLRGVHHTYRISVNKVVQKLRSRCVRSVRCSPWRWSIQPAGTHRFRQTWAAICAVHTTQIVFRAQWPERRADNKWKRVLRCTPRRSTQKDTLALAANRQNRAPNRDLEIAKPQRKGLVYS